MPFDMGFDFRGTAGFVTDPSYAVPVLAEAFPHTYTNGNGQSITAGVGPVSDGNNDIASGNDPRIAGYRYRQNNGIPTVWQIDLNSGSAPGAGTYTLDVAMGSPNQTFSMTSIIKDTASPVLDLTNGGSGYLVAEGHFTDATGADVAATTSWTGTTVEKVFATTTLNIEIGPIALTGFTCLAHFRLTLVEETGPRMIFQSGSLQAVNAGYW
jgi:hypothetical protein